jgi:hypothetical protein
MDTALLANAHDAKPRAWTAIDFAAAEPVFASGQQGGQNGITRPRLNQLTVDPKADRGSHFVI